MNEEEVQSLIDKALQTQKEEFEFYYKFLSDKIAFKRDIKLLNNTDLIIGEGSGTKIGTTTDQKIGFYNTTPIIQPTDSISGASFSEKSGTDVNAGSTFDGYTIGQIVKALKNIGLLE